MAQYDHNLVRRALRGQPTRSDMFLEREMLKESLQIPVKHRALRGQPTRFDMFREQGRLKQSLRIPVKSRLFVSYQHSRDQDWYNGFCHDFGKVYDLFTDTSLQRKYDSNNTGYVDRAIRENNITGSSITVVLYGTDTWKRKYVDWEIRATLYKQHALLGIILPSLSLNRNNKYIIHGRLYENIQSGYAHWIKWSEDADVIAKAIATAKGKACVTSCIRNSTPKMSRNLT